MVTRLSFLYNNFALNPFMPDADLNCCASFGPGIGPIHIDNLACNGLEYRITDCQYDNDTAEDSHSEDWSVYCYSPIGKHIMIQK